MSNIFAHPAMSIWQTKIMAAKLGMFPMSRFPDGKIVLVVPNEYTPKGIIENITILREVN